MLANSYCNCSPLFTSFHLLPFSYFHIMVLSVAPYFVFFFFHLYLFYEPDWIIKFHFMRFPTCELMVGVVVVVVKAALCGYVYA